jgi:nucleoside-diphosphate-sugar epimerase
MKKTKKIIVTGAAGLVGQNLIPLLVENNYEVIAIDRNKKNLQLLQRLNPTIKYLETDVSNRGEWEKEFENSYCVIELHAQIASQQKEEFSKSNVTGVSNVIEVCKKNKIMNLIHISSSVVISVADDEYTKTKRLGEEIVKKSGIPYMILRPTLMYGLFDSKHLGWITRFMEKIPIIPMPGSGKYIRQPLFVEDLCKIILTLIERKLKNQTWNIIGREKIYYIDVLKMIAKAKGLRRIFIPIPLFIFGFLLKLYGFIMRKPMFTKEQMKALVAGDIFEVQNWWDEFDVEYTSLEKGIWKTWHSEESKYAEEMGSPH